MRRTYGLIVNVRKTIRRSPGDFCIGQSHPSPGTDAAGASSELQFDHGTLDDKDGYRPIESSYHPGVYSATDLTIVNTLSPDGAASHFKATCDHA